MVVDANDSWMILETRIRLILVDACAPRLDALIKLAAKRAAATLYGRRFAPVRSGSEMGSRAIKRIHSVWLFPIFVSGEYEAQFESYAFVGLQSRGSQYACD
jgi:hypothetical protein